MSTTNAEEVIERTSESVSTEKVRSLFTTDAELVTVGSITGAKERNNNITLLQGAGKIADLYTSLAIFREASGGDWKLVGTEADLETRRLLVRWKTEAPLKVEGTDAFVFEEPSLVSSNRLPLSSDGDQEDVASLCRIYFNENDYSVPLKIRRIDNRQLKIAGVTADSAWAQSFVSAAMRSGPIPDATIAELFRALTMKKAPTKKEQELEYLAMPELSDAAAVSFYGIIRSLHRDLRNIDSGLSSTPAGEFVADSIELRGLLGEVLVRGSQNYKRLLGIAISSLRAAIQAKAVRLAAEPRPTIEVTAKGSIKVNFILALWVSTPNPLGGGVMMGQSNNNINQGFGVPLKIELLTEYFMDKAGEISEHRILESRLNGVLTPGDMFSRWVKGLIKEDKGEGNAARPSAMESLVDALAWVRSMQDRK